MPASTFSVRGVTPWSWPLTSTATPCGFDSMTSVPVVENSHSGGGTYCAAVKADVMVTISAAIHRNFLNRALIGPRGVEGAVACQSSWRGSTSCACHASRLGFATGAGALAVDGSSFGNVEAAGG